MSQAKIEEETLWRIIAETIGMKFVDAFEYQQTIEDLQKYLDAIGAAYVTAKEITTPGHPAIARECGYDYFLPTRLRWVSLIGLCGVFKKLREEIKKPIAINNWWRPEPYNKRVKGALLSDHTTATAFDIAIPDDKARKKAIEFLIKTDETNPMLKMSLGIHYNSHIHFGINSPGGRRRW